VAIRSAAFKKIFALVSQSILAHDSFAANAASIALHRSKNFHSVGTLTAVGFKFGRWVDTVLMQRPLDDSTVASTEDYCVRD